MKVLVAEDEPVSRRALEEMLAQWGYEVVSACDGLDAWGKLQSGDAPPLLVLDWMMPGMDGVEICRELRKTPREDYFYVILLTIRQQKEDIVDGMEAGADDYICKPFDWEELKVRLRAGQRILDLQSQARDAARLAAIRDIAGGVAHNFNNLFTSMLGYAGFVRNALQKQGASLDDIEKLVAAVTRASSLAAQLLACAHPTRGVRGTTTLGAMARGLAAHCQKTLPDNIELVLNVEAQDTRLKVVSESLREAMAHICANAQEAMPDRGTLRITAHGSTRPRGQGEPEFAQIDIADTGVGIEPSILPKIFDPFFSTKQTVGVGISLAVTRRVIEDHEGRMEVDSVPGDGTTFRIFLPIAEEDDSE